MATLALLLTLGMDAARTSSAISLPLPQKADTLRHSVKRTTPITLKDLDRKPFDLKDPEQGRTDTTYDERSDMYVLGTRIGDSYINTPIVMTPEQYKKWTLQRSMRAYYRQKNTEEFQKKDKDKFDFTDMNFDLGPAEKIFGPGGVKIQTNGEAQIKIGGTMKSVDNPSLPIRQRKTFGFDFDEQINLSLKGQIGDKMDLNLNYDTESTFDIDSKNLKLKYDGKEDEIVKLIEGGNISMPTNNSLITGASTLFGVRTDLQFGKLKLQTVVSQKKSISKSVSSKGGTQLTDFEIAANNYEANRHFFLSHFFRDNYDNWMSTIPNIRSGITINRVEVWVTNKNGTTTNTRNIVGFTDLGEHDVISNSNWTASGTVEPSNMSNTLYTTIVNEYTGARDISQVFSALSNINNFNGGRDYEKLESARLLPSSEYTVNKALGTISLKTSLQTDQVLAVAFEYTFRGKTFQVGEFSTDQKDNKSCLYVKTLKNATNTPKMGNWKLMMKNVYNLGATSVDKANFRLDIKYLNDTSGVYISYLPDEQLKNTTLLKLMGLDRLDNKNEAHPNGYFDFVEGYTIDRQNGRIYFPTVEPFGKSMKKFISDDATAQKYMFQELYDSTSTVAKQIVEKDKFILAGRYKATTAGTISLGAVGVPRGSVVVTAGGVTLIENSDYTVNYAAGEVTIINQSILDAGTPVNVSLESTGESLERKTMLGLNWEYDFTKNFILGGTLMHLSEQSLTTKVAMGNEPLNNTIWGLNLSWNQKSQWLTDMLDRLPFLSCTSPSTINFSAEFAHLITGSNSQSQAGASYMDDFENTKNPFDISTPSDWVLSSCPARFKEEALYNDVSYGKNRARLNWYHIDPLFTRRSSSLTPSHIKSDVDQLSNHYVREIYRTELFPNKELLVGQSTTLDILNLSYTPNIRGPYNLDTNVNEYGQLNDPKKRWGGMMRSIETTDFERANIEYIEFWMLDPFIYTRGKESGTDGDLYFDLGDISEDILKDGHKFYESGMPLDGNEQMYDKTIWGRYPTQTSVTYAFNTSAGSRKRQDVGLNGLTSEEEALFPTYATYLQEIKGIVRPEVYDSIAKDPAGDDYHYFRGSDFDNNKVSILDRYTRINNPEGNSPDSESSPERYSTAYKTNPDVEDVNKDYTLNEYNNYYEYRVHLHPDSMKVGMGYIVDHRHTTSSLRNGKKEEVDWYLFRVPLNDETRKQFGNINDFSSIRFMRMYLTNFEKPIILRFGTLELVSGEWRNYKYSLNGAANGTPQGSLEVAAINIEENNDKTPVNYVLPPGVSPVVNPQQSQLVEDNEQALNITVKNLPTGEARAIYKNYNLDVRQYKHIQMFVHANALTGDQNLKDGETSVFIRMGSDYRNNYYEYEIPLQLTVPGHYDRYSEVACEAVWPKDNMLDIDFDLLTKVKQNRNNLKYQHKANYSKPYSEYDPDKPNNKVTVMGNPSLGEIRTMMIGVRNNSRAVKNVEVWVNELRLQHYTDDGGWAARAKLDMHLSDLATLSMNGHVETSGFGGIEQGINERRNSDLYEYNMTTNVQLGRFLPEKAKLNAPLYFSYSKKKEAPKYNPLDTDMELDDALDACATKQQRDSLENITTTTSTDKNFSLSNIKFNIATKNHPMPYDPANFAFSYSHSHRHTAGETTVRETNDNWKFNANYSYSPTYKPLEPFKTIKSNSEWLNFFKSEKINWLPQSIMLNSDINRTYYELQERDMENLSNNSLPLTWSSDFLWNRSLNLNWDITNNIHASLNTATNAEIIEPYVPVNKSLYPDDYTMWKDSVWQSMKHFGTPLTFRQDFNASWKVPITLIPIFKWINADISYDSAYGWERGTTMEDGSTLGNMINSQRNVNVNTRFNLDDLYNLVPFLKKTNRYYQLNAAHNATKQKQKEESKKKVFEQEVQLNADSTISLIHNFHTRRLRVTALLPNGKRYALKYKIKNGNIINITNKDSAKVKVTIRPTGKDEESTLYKVLRFTARRLMMVRNINVSYTSTYNMNLPGFMPNVGDFFGQNNQGIGGLKPGLDFAFGLIDDHYINRAQQNGWLLNNDSVSTPASTNLNDNLLISATIEPLEGLKVDLTANRTTSRSRSIQYTFAGAPTTQSGTFTMTTISIGSAFDGIGNADNNYTSKTFSRFLEYLPKFRDRVEAKYANAIYPAGTTLAGKNFDPANGTVNTYSADVMIPAFLAAYCGGNEKSSLDVFPTLKRLLPNWKVTYGGFMRYPWFKRNFKSFTLEHAYKSVFSVGSYNSYSSYMESMGLGFITDATTGNPIPNSLYDISTVSINENFSPFCGISVTFNNNLTASLRYNRTRVLTLSMPSQQLTESQSKDLVIGLGYKINDLKLFGKPKRRVATNKKRKTNEEEENKPHNENVITDTNQTGMSNPLNLRADFSLRDQSAINRNIITMLSQATSGNKALKISFAADYTMSKLLTLTAYYDRQTTTPLLSASAFPTTTQDFGMSLKFSLQR